MSAEFFAPTCKPFTAKYEGRCALSTCEKRGEILQGDAVAYRDDELMHLSCVRRCERGQTDPYCGKCSRYHVGQCA